jgi:hypothetical protein
MMFYHDGLRIFDAEKARHSSKIRATLLTYTPHRIVAPNVMLILLSCLDAATATPRFVGRSRLAEREQLIRVW